MNVCDSILSLSPYQGGKPISELQRELGLSTVIKLASNENPLSISDKVRTAIEQAMHEVGRYPDGDGFELKQAISKYLSFSTEQITLGNGSNDLLELLARICVCHASDEVIFSQYAFVVYLLVTKALGAKAVITPAKDFAHDLDAMRLAITDNTQLVFIANPNNPTGTLLEEGVIYKFLSQVPRSIIVVLDQAYIEYLDGDDNTIAWLKEFDNLVITRTFSKAYGLAGLRVGYSLSSSEIADYLNRIRQPFNVNHIAQSAAISALADKDFLQQSVASNKQGLVQLSSGFEALGLSYIPSSANFIAVKFDKPKIIYQRLLEKGFIVRPVEMQGYLRVSVGTKSENVAFLDALKLVL